MTTALLSRPLAPCPHGQRQTFHVYTCHPPDTVRSSEQNSTSVWAGCGETLT